MGPSMLSDFETMRLRVEQALSALAEAHDRMSAELARGLILSTGMMRDLSLALQAPPHDPSEPSEG